jgi:hypothetical protein
VENGKLLGSMISQAKETFQFDAIDDVLSDIAKGRMVIVTDDADRLKPSISWQPMGAA